MKTKYEYNGVKLKRVLVNNYDCFKGPDKCFFMREDCILLDTDKGSEFHCYDKPEAIFLPTKKQVKP